MSSQYNLFWVTVMTAFLLTTYLAPASASDHIASHGPMGPGEGEWSDNVTAVQGSDLKSPSIALVNGTLHAVFLGNGVQHVRSLDGGATWSEPITLGPDGQDTPYTPTVAGEGDTVVVFWPAIKASGTRSIFWARSTDGGETFEDSAYLAGSNNREADQPRALAKGGTIYLLWADNRDDPLLEHEIYFKKSEDGGETWRNDKRVTSALRDSFNPDFDVVGNTIHVVWEDERDGPHWTYYKKSTDGGVSFGVATKICGAQEASMPNLAAEGSKVHVIWWRPSYEFHYLSSTDNGDSWGAETIIVSTTDETRHEGVVEASGDHLEFVYNQNGKLFYMNSTDGGGSWSIPVQLADGLNSGGFEGYWGPLVTSDIGSFLVVNDLENKILFRYKGLYTDLSISAGDVTFDSSYRVGDTTMVNITATVHNTGVVDAWGAELLFYEGTEAPGNLVGTAEIGPISVGGQSSATIAWEPPVTGPDMIVRVNGGGPMELVLSNNVVQVQSDISNFFPVPAFDADPLSALTLEDVTFDGSSSSDPDGTLASFLFDFGDGNDTGWVSTSIVTHAYSDDGNFTASMRVKDDKGGSSDERSVNITIENRAPVAIIGTDDPSMEVLTWEAYNVTAINSKDMDGDIISYNWDLGDGNTSTEMAVSHQYEDDGIYTINLTVTDDDDAYSGTELQVMVGNRGPSATIFVNTTTTMKGWGVEFDGQGSYDPDGEIASYSWDFGDGRTGEGVLVDHTFKQGGTYTVDLTIVDDDGAVDNTTVEITVRDQVPVAKVSADLTEVLTLEFVKFDSTGSLDPDGKIETYNWDFGDGSGSTVIAPKHSYQKAGEYLVELTVIDDAGLNATASITIKVINREPTAVIKADTVMVEVDGAVELNALYSTDEDGSIVQCDWDFGDGQSGTGFNVTHSYSKAGTYILELIVVDDDGGSSGPVTIVITVKEPYVPPPPPPNGDGQEDLTWVYMLSGGVTVAIIVIVVLILLFMRRQRPSLPADLDLQAEQQGPQEQAPQPYEQGPTGYEGQGPDQEHYQEGSQEGQYEGGYEEEQQRYNGPSE